MPITRRITEAQYKKDIADAEKRGFEAARKRLEGEAAQPLSAAQIAEMDESEINSRWDEISEALKNGAARPQEGEG